LNADRAPQLKAIVMRKWQFYHSIGSNKPCKENGLMKRCFSCNRTYSNDDLNFCSYDGTSLSDSYDPEATTVLTKPIKKAVQASSPLTTYATPQPKLRTIINRASCPHCENTTPQTLLYTYEYVDDFSYLDPGQMFTAAYFLFMCGTCDELVLYKADSLYDRDVWSRGNDWADPRRYEELFKIEDNKKNLSLAWPAGYRVRQSRRQLEINTWLL
jgi:hypothetical protein